MTLPTSPLSFDCALRTVPHRHYLALKQKRPIDYPHQRMSACICSFVRPLSVGRPEAIVHLPGCLDHVYGCHPAHIAALQFHLREEHR